MCTSDDAVLSKSIVPPVVQPANVGGSWPAPLRGYILRRVGADVPKMSKIAALKQKLLSAKKLLTKMDDESAAAAARPPLEEPSWDEPEESVMADEPEEEFTLRLYKPLDELCADANATYENEHSMSPEPSHSVEPPPANFYDADEFTRSQWQGLVSMPGYCCFAAALEFVYGDEECARCVSIMYMTTTMLAERWCRSSPRSST